MQPNEALVLPDKALFRIGEVANLLGVETHVVRFWQQQFVHLRPTRSSTGRFLYSRSQVEQLERIRRLLHVERLTIEGARKALRSGKAKLLLGRGQDVGDPSDGSVQGAAAEPDNGSDAASTAKGAATGATIAAVSSLRAASRGLRAAIEAERERLEEGDDPAGEASAL